MSGIGVLSIVGPIVIVIALLVMVGFTFRANRNPVLHKSPGEPAKRGEVSGGVIEGSPAQQNRRDEAPRAE